MNPAPADSILELPLPGPPVGSAAGSRPSRRSSDSGGIPFLVGPENRCVEALLAALARSLCREYSPIVLHGPTGCGKSRLAAALAELARAGGLARRVVFATAVDFARELADAVDASAIDDFRARYRRAELLVLDDVHRLEDHRAAQEELIRTLDAVDEALGTIVVTTGPAPGELRALAPALRSRLAAGLVVPLAYLGKSGRLALLRHAARRQGVALPEPLANRLADELPGDARSLLGAVAELRVRLSEDPGGADPEWIEGLLCQRRAARPGVHELALATARRFGVRLAELRSASRRRKVVSARAVAMYLARRIGRHRLQEIGAYFAGRDHTTVLHNCRKVEQLLRVDAQLSKTVASLQSKWETIE